MDELDRISRQLRDSASSIDRRVEGVVKRGSLNIKNDWQSDARRQSDVYATHYPRTISFDVQRITGWIEGETGPDKNRPQGALGNLLEFGSVHNPPQNSGGRALQREEPRYIQSLGDVAGDLL